MSSDSNQPPDEPAPPTVRMPVQPAGQPPPPGRVPAEQDPAPAPRQEPATRPAPQWQPTPPPTSPPPTSPPPASPPPSSPPPSSPPQKPQPQWTPTVREPGFDPTVQAPAQGRAAQDPVAPAQWAQQPRPGQREPWDTPQAAQPGGQWGTPPPQPPQPGGQWGPPGPPQQMRRGRPRRRTRRWVMATFTVVVILVLLVIGDRVAAAITENAFASNFQSQGVPVKPSVNIEGFPFLTQLAAKDFKQVDISASNIPVNLPTGGTLTINSVHGTIKGLHISGYSSSANAKVDRINATAFVSFGSLAAAGSLGGTGVTLSQAGPNTVKITAGVAGLSDTEEATITQTGPQSIAIKINDTGGLGGLLGTIGFNSFSFSLPKVVPASLRITALTLNSQGLTVTAAATNAVFNQGK